ncbi:hyaluronoglucosaminidase [Ancylostoma ceylanicum]|uniref:Hyaluronidase n=1 Tax=Ancylostoma ceylanicum TaxID=53326 RepID=A0A0D6LAN0_9BILA|nr:hyaluronoglucosaminidase [Ancylostoma ceylanicum]
MDAHALQKILKQNTQQMQLMQQMMHALLSGELKPQQAVALTQPTLISELNGRMKTFTFDPDMGRCFTRWYDRHQEILMEDGASLAEDARNESNEPVTVLMLQANTPKNCVIQRNSIVKVFRNQSIALARINNIGIHNESEIESIAEKDFNDAASYHVESMISFRMMFIFNESSALYPSIYLGFNATSDQRFRYVQAILREARRVANKFTPPLPIYAYSKIEYNPLKEIADFYDTRDLCSTIKQPADLGIDGIIFWSSSNNMTLRCPYIKDNMEKENMLSFVLEFDLRASAIPLQEGQNHNKSAGRLRKDQMSQQWQVCAADEYNVSEEIQ